MNYDVNKGKMKDNNIEQELKFSANPKENVTLDMSKKTETTFYNDVASTNETTASKLTIKHGDCTTTYDFESNLMKFFGKGKAYDADGWKVVTMGAFETG